MLCPTCKNPLIVVEFEKTELDFCNNCHGVWFDSGELELLLEKGGIGNGVSSLSNLLQSKNPATSEKKRHCPICRRNMNKFSTGNGRGIIIDACDRGDGIWFDGGEVEQVMHMMSMGTASKPADNKVFNFVKEVLKAHHGS